MDRRERKALRRATRQSTEWINQADSIDDILKGADCAETIEWVKAKLTPDSQIVFIIENPETVYTRCNATFEHANWLLDHSKKELLENGY